MNYEQNIRTWKQIFLKRRSAMSKTPKSTLSTCDVRLQLFMRRREMAMIQRCGAVARRMLTPDRTAAFSSLSSSSAAAGAPILCGRGDKRTKKGKRFKGSYGNSRPKKEKMIERIKDKVEVPRSTPWPLPFKLI
ncbi:small ribosomal subunit protein bTHXm [Rhododendron vialii]|uniref:small ribosomal subunit protein bTHXm n=1 Tax=Rhododendron vialii TaxID=182163 RepID=UPI00265F8C32|nr:small ribosomal subunit protein bTHXm [Rhododendron vialii]